jgi:hypothetical protein
MLTKPAEKDGSKEMDMRTRMRMETQAAKDRRIAQGKAKGGRIIPHVMRGGVEYKSCGGKCGSLKPLDQFGEDKTRWDGLNTKCKECRK